METEF